MIRRKLTRLEVTLDDTKELDELFSKPVQIGLTSAATLTTTVTLTAPSNSTSTKISNNFFQKQLLFIGKETSDQSNLIEPSIADSASTLTTPTTAHTAAFIDQQSANPQNIEFTESNESIGYNPQPYNPSTRFQLNNQES